MLPLLRTYIGYGALLCFFLSGLVINVVQLICFALIRPFSKSFYRTVNHYLQYSSWSQTVAIADWFGNLECKIYFADKQSEQQFGKHSAIVITNHRYDIDWLAAWMFSDKLGTLGSDKAMVKSSLRYVPIIGWGWSLSDMVFLSRNWKKDEENLRGYMKVLLTYPKSSLLAYYEGTRFTKEKHQASLKFAQEKQLDINLKHHLVPRTRGFQCMMKMVQEGKKNDPKLVYNLFSMQVALENDDNSAATLTAILSGRKSCVHIHIKQLHPEAIDFTSEDAGTKYLFDVFREKDQLHEYFLRNKKFPGNEYTYKRRIQSLLNISAWLLITYSSLIYLYYICFTSGSMLSMILFSSLGLSAIISIRLLIHSTQVSKSSAYGTSSKAEKRD